MRPAYWLYQTFWRGLDWLYPPSCGGCGRPGERWCCACNQQAQLLFPRICACCGHPIEISSRSPLCMKCQSAPPVFRALRSWAPFHGPVRNAIHRLKYRRDVALGERLSQLLAQLFVGLSWPVDLILPVPLSDRRHRERGYNQAACLAYPLALSTGIAYRAGGLFRTRETQTQVGLSASDRKSNVLDAFRATPRVVKGKNVLVVDDVATTGSTINACAQALLAAGAVSVYGITLARAVHYPVE